MAQIKAVAMQLKQRISLWLILICGSILLSGCSQMAGGGDMVSVLNHLMIQSSAIFNLMISFCYLAGAGFVTKGIYDFKVYGEQRTSASQQTTIRVPLTHILVGMGFLYTPSMISILSNSVMGQSTVILAYLDPNSVNAAAGTWGSVEVAVVTLLQVCGLVSYIKGFFILSHTQAGAGGGWGKGLTHVFSGLLLLNLQTFMQILYGSL